MAGFFVAHYARTNAGGRPRIPLVGINPKRARAFPIAAIIPPDFCKLLMRSSMCFGKLFKYATSAFWLTNNERAPPVRTIGRYPFAY